MFIQTEETPNPATLKFIPDGHVVLKNGTAEFKNQKQAETKSPLALQLFTITGVEEIQAIIMDFFLTGKDPMFEIKEDSNAKGANEISTQEDSEIVKQIKELIEIKVRPAVAMDGGDIIFHSFENGVVYLVLKGSCSGCPSSTVTLKNGIENMLKHYIPEVEAVEQVSED